MTDDNVKKRGDGWVLKSFPGSKHSAFSPENYDKSRDWMLAIHWEDRKVMFGRGPNTEWTVQVGAIDHVTYQEGAIGLVDDKGAVFSIVSLPNNLPMAAALETELYEVNQAYPAPELLAEVDTFWLGVRWSEPEGMWQKLITGAGIKLAEFETGIGSFEIYNNGKARYQYTPMVWWKDVPNQPSDWKERFYVPIEEISSIELVKSHDFIGASPYKVSIVPNEKKGFSVEDIKTLLGVSDESYRRANNTALYRSEDCFIIFAFMTNGDRNVLGSYYGEYGEAVKVTKQCQNALELGRTYKKGDAGSSVSTEGDL